VLSVGIGGMHRNVKDDEPFGPEYKNPDIDFVIDAGPGIRVPIGDALVVRTDYRLLLMMGTESYERKGDTFLDWEWTAGVSFRWGGAKDTDKDGIVDEDEKPECVDKAEDFDNWEDLDGCPDPDNDGDGVLDVDEGSTECATQPEDMDGFEDTDGCPDPDNDGDGVLDASDECDREAGTPEARGCPDADGDAIADKKDACPDKAGDAKWEGCPDSDGDGIGDNLDECVEEAGPKAAGGCADADADNVPDKVDECKDESSGADTDRRFSNGCKALARLQSSANPILDAVVAVLAARAEIEKLEIGVYTDDKGDDKDANITLASERSQNIIKYLMGKGVDEQRLLTKGYGHVAPTNATDERPMDRVEFKTLRFNMPEPEKKEEAAPAPEKKEEAAPAPEKKEDGDRKLERPAEGGDKPAEGDRKLERPADPKEEAPAEKKEEAPAEKKEEGK
jgi:outer membrane protein OmpA-like peptidoglycan-associated protein